MYHSYYKFTSYFPRINCPIYFLSPFFTSQKISHPLLLLVIAASVIIIEGGPTTCPPTHFVKYSSSSGSSRKVEGCRLCPDCPEGHELSIPCGSNITDNTNYDCVTCKETKTYSDSYGIENCKPCQQCGSRNVIQECTVTHDRKCGNETSTPTTASIESTPNITDSGEAKLSTPATTSIGSTPNITDSGDEKLSTSATTSLESTATARQDPYHSTTAERSGSIKAYALAVPVTIAIVLAIALTAILCRRRCKTSPELKSKI